MTELCGNCKNLLYDFNKDEWFCLESLEPKKFKDEPCEKWEEKK